MQDMGYDPVLNYSLQALDLCLLSFDRLLIGSCSPQKIDELNLSGLDFLAPFLEPRMESVAFGTERPRLLRCQIELKEDGLPR